MDRYIKPVLLGTVMGGIVVGLISGAQVMAGTDQAEQQVTKIIRVASNTLFPPPKGELLKLGDDEFNAVIAPEVSLTPTATSTVRKIGYGASRMVTITTTTSGVYSSDALRSAHVRYPGIEVLGGSAPPGAGLPLLEQLAAWSHVRGQWVATPTLSANSFMIVTRDGESVVLNGSAGRCIIGPSIAFC